MGADAPADAAPAVLELLGTRCTFTQRWSGSDIYDGERNGVRIQIRTIAEEPSLWREVAVGPHLQVRADLDHSFVCTPQSLLALEKLIRDTYADKEREAAIRLESIRDERRHLFGKEET